MTSIKSRLRELRENFYLSSLEEQDPEGAVSPAEVQATPSQEVPLQEVPPGSTPPDAQGDFIDPEGYTRNQEGEFTDNGAYGGYGIGNEEPQHTAKELGRIYELNKIYYRLYTINKILNNIPDPKISEIREMVSEAFDMFRMISNNVVTYKDMLDDVILKYYAFIGRVVLTLEKYFKITSESDKDVKYFDREGGISDSGKDQKTDGR